MERTDEERTDLSGVAAENTDGVRVPQDRLRLRSSVESNGPRGTVKLGRVRLADRADRAEWTDRERTGLSGVWAPTERLRLRDAVAKLGPLGNVNDFVQTNLPAKLAVNTEVDDSTDRMDFTDRTDCSGVPITPRSRDVVREQRDKLGSPTDSDPRNGVPNLASTERLRERRPVCSMGPCGTVRSAFPTFARQRLDVSSGRSPAAHRPTRPSASWCALEVMGSESKWPSPA